MDDHDAWLITAGDTAPWATHIPRVWRAVADPTARAELPLKPRTRTGEQDPCALVERSAAWWAPLLQVLMFGCGWPRPDLGVAAWLEAGRPTADPRLDVVDRWWRTDVLELLAWSQSSYFTDKLVGDVAADLGLSPGTDRLDPARFERLLQTFGHDGKAEMWGNDTMHVASHVTAPLWASGSAELVVGTEPTATRPGRAVLMAESYAGWYRALHEQAGELPRKPSDRSWQVDVVVRPVGWLGTYRWSSASGRWFAGRHRWHELGVG